MNLRPCLVLGTGFHRWVLGDAGIQQRIALADWTALLDKTALKLGVAAPKGIEDPALRWEQLLTTAAQDGFRLQRSKSCSKKVCEASERIQINKIEAHAKKAVQEILKQCCAEYPSFSRRAQLPNNGTWGGRCVLQF